VRGQGRYTDDFALEGQCFAAFVRSPHPHARVSGIDVEAAAAAEGVIAVLTGADYVADGCTGIRQVPMPADALRHDRPALPRETNGRATLDELHWPLAIDRIRYAGEAVAVVIAETMNAARDAAELVEVSYETFPALLDMDEAIAPGAPVLFEIAPDNIAVAAEFGDREATEAALAGAAVVIEHRFRNQRVANAQMEPRAAIGAYDAAADTCLMIAGSQGAVRQRVMLAAALNVPVEKVRVISPDVGGGFGPRTNLYPEQAVVTWAARRLGRPVRWTSDRSEAFLTDFQGRDSIARARLGLDADGRIRALAVDTLFNVGGQTVSYVPLSNSSRVLTSVYDVPVAHVRARGVVTNTVPTAPYRGAGRPESTFVMERLLDLAAERLSLDRVEIRRRNLVRREQLPYRSAVGLTYDSGDFHANMAQALELADWDGFPARREEAQARGRLAGIGIANYVESPVGAPHERVRVTVRKEGVVEVVAGTQSTGQGHETSFAQVMADELGVSPEAIRLVTGDTALVPGGGGTHSDRSMRLAGTLMVESAHEVRERCRVLAAALLQRSAEEIRFEDGLFFAPGANRRFTVFNLAEAAEGEDVPPELRGDIVSDKSFTGRIPAYPTGSAVCELEVDPETGTIEITRYTTVDDVGQPINPLILHGQVHGGIVQGVGQALCEQVAYDPESGQVLTGSFMDYAMPIARMFPRFTVAMAEDPTAGNPLRVKGGGESGITPALGVFTNALVHALSPLGVRDFEMPATPLRVWQAIARAKG
jgi:carbon-monoxide dehydrogenase large subunit